MGAVTVEEMMELATSRYIDFPGVGIVDLDAQAPEQGAGSGDRVDVS
jgi:hypothetical protein